MSKPIRTCEGFIDTHYYTHNSLLKRGKCGMYYIERTLHRSFGTLEDANRFAEGKNVRDIYRSKGKYVVEWIKIIPDHYGYKWAGIDEQG